MRMARLALVLLGGMAAGVVHAQTSDPEPLPDNPRFVYPATAQRAGVVGDVTFAVEVDAQGAVTGVKVREVPARGLGFEEGVEATLRKWRFRPAMAEGKPVAGVATGSVAFQLHPEDEKRIREAVARFAEAWTANRPEAMAALLDPEVAVVAAGGAAAGRTAAAEWIAARRAAGAAALEPKLKRITFLAPDLAYLDLTARPASGAPGGQPPFWPALIRHAQGEWRFISLRDRGGLGSAVRAGDVTEPRKVKNVVPVYPDQAKQEHVSGIVILECLVAREGHITDVAVLRGHPLLNSAAVAAVRQWVYTPTLIDGQAVPVIMTVTVNFRLR